MIEVFIKKPIYNNFVYVRDLYLKQAEYTGEKLHIKTPKGELVCTPEEWKKGAKYMEKVFKYAGEPMKLWGNNVPVEYPMDKLL